MIRKILIVDDSVEMLQLIRAMLEQEGYHIISATNGAEGLTKARQEKPSLIIADVLMPEMDGFIFFKELRKNPLTAHVPVLILTARGKMEDTFRAVGVNGFLVKPFNADQLLREVEKQVGVAEPSRSVGPTPPKTAKKINESPAPVAKKKALLFGLAESILADMREQLQTMACGAVICRDPQELRSHCEKEFPELILLELSADSHMPIEDTLQDIQMVMRGRPQGTPSGGREPAIVLYKEHQAVSGDSSMGAEIADTESLLAKCAEIGFTKYIGLYSSLTFKIKIKEFLSGR